MKKWIVYTFILIQIGCSIHEFKIINETKSRIELKFYFKKELYDIDSILGIDYYNRYLDPSRIKLDYDKFTISIIINPFEKIIIYCSYDSEDIPNCNYETLNLVMFVEFTHLDSNKKIKFDLKSFLELKKFPRHRSIIITDVFFK
jgi:hypothetical protein